MFRGCQRFFNWLVAEGELNESPLVRMKPPRIPEQLPEKAAVAGLGRWPRVGDGPDCPLSLAVFSRGRAEEGSTT